MDASASLKKLREEDLDAVSAGKHPTHFGNHFAKIKHWSGETSNVQTNIAVQIGLVIGGTLVQIIGQSNISDPLLSVTM